MMSTTTMSSTRVKPRSSLLEANQRRPSGIRMGRTMPEPSAQVQVGLIPVTRLADRIYSR